MYANVLKATNVTKPPKNGKPSKSLDTPTLIADAKDAENTAMFNQAVKGDAELVVKDSAASVKAHATRRKNTASNTKETYKLLRQASGMASKKTDTGHIGSVAASLGII
jgi:hypothetical protein